LSILNKIPPIPLIIGFLLLLSCNSTFPENHGKVESKLFLGETENQPLIVAFGGSEGGMIYAQESTQAFRNKALTLGYAILSIGYFGIENTPSGIDRISLDAIYNSIQNYRNHPQINGDRVIIVGSSRGGELVLNLASRYKDLDAVIAIVPSNVSLPNQFGGFQRSSWTFNGEEIPYLKPSPDALKKYREGNFYDGMAYILDNVTVIEAATIPVEKIECPILIISAKNDEVWPSTKMSGMIIQRLKNNNFNHYYEHIVLNGGHKSPSQNYDTIFSFLNEQFRNEKPNTKKLE
jgi:pimeloyl-ACP methyl ester carboxylesterase